MSRCCTLSPERIPNQYRARACEARKIMSDTTRSVDEIASSVAIAELVQLLYFAVMAGVYALALFNVISPQVAGGIAVALLPLEACASYYTFTHYKQFSRVMLTSAAVFTLALCAGFALCGAISDSAVTICAGGIACHLFRNLSEYFDAKRALQDPEYRDKVMKQA